MTQRNFHELVRAKWDEQKFVSVGLDSNYELIPAHLKTGTIATDLFEFNKAIVDATKDIVCAYKPNSAFYEAYGADGIVALQKTCDYIRTQAPDVAIILDAKRADIGNTNEGYTRFAFDYLVADAITVHPYLGSEAMQPFLEYSEKGTIVLCKTSNPGSAEFQNILIRGASSESEEALYAVVAKYVQEQWNKNKNCWLVVGGTYPEEIAEVRAIASDIPFLIPGIGAQGGDVETTVKAAQDSRGQGFVINSSRGIIFASSGEDFADAARAETQKLHDTILATLTNN